MSDDVPRQLWPQRVPLATIGVGQPNSTAPLNIKSKAKSYPNSRTGSEASLVHKFKSVSDASGAENSKSHIPLKASNNDLKKSLLDPPRPPRRRASTSAPQMLGVGAISHRSISAPTVYRALSPNDISIDTDTPSPKEYPKPPLQKLPDLDSLKSLIVDIGDAVSNTNVKSRC